MVLQAILALAVVLMEFPSGYLADRLGYRKTLILSACISTLCWIIYFFSESYLPIVIAEVLYGISMSLISGTDHALLYESLKEQNKLDQFKKWSGRMQGAGQFAEGSAALIAGTSYLLWERLPFFLEIIVSIFGIIIAFYMLEPTRNKPKFQHSYQQIKGILKHVFINTPQLRYFIYLGITLGLSSFFPVWFIQLYAQQAGASLELLSVNWSIANFSVALGALFSYKIANILGNSKSLLLCIGCVFVAYFGLGTQEALYGFTFYYFLTIMRGINNPILHHEEQKLVTSEDRAAMSSLRSLFFRLSFIFLGPSLGFAMEYYGMHLVLIALSFILSFIALSFWAKIYPISIMRR